MPPWIADLLKVALGGGGATLVGQLLLKWKSKADLRDAAVKTEATERGSEGGFAKDMAEAASKLNETSLNLMQHLEERVVRLDGEVTTLRGQVDTLERDMRALRKEKHDLANRCMAAEARAERAESALRAEQEAHASTRAECTRTAGRLEQVEGELRQAKQTMESAAHVRGTG